MSKSKIYDSLDDELIEKNDELVECVRAAIPQALSHANQGAATLLIAIGDAAFDHIDKPVGFDEAVDKCRTGPPTSDDHSFGKFEANAAVIKFKSNEIANLENGTTRPRFTQPKGGTGIEETRSLKFSDRANGERLAAIYKDDLRHHKGEWREWDLTRWRTNDKGAHLRAKTIGQDIREELHTDGVTDPEMSKYYFRAAKSAESARGIRDTLDLAHSMPAFDGDRIEWDADPWLFNVKNGTVNLKTGELHFHRRDDYITRVSPTRYDPDEKGPLWNKFLGGIFGGDDELISYVKWAVGYSITGLQTDHVFFVAHGTGANGKSTFFQVLRNVLGPDYFHTLDSEAIMLHKQAQHRSPIAQLRGKRFVLCNESMRSRRLDTTLIKQLTGGDSIRANLMRKDAEEFMPESKLWLCTNHRPTIGDQSYAMWRRIRSIPFDEIFKGKNADPAMAAKLQSEKKAIVTWIVEGAKQHFEKGEPELPEVVRAATAEYEIDEDVIADFLADICETWPHATVTVAALYRARKFYTDGRCESKKVFGQLMTAKGFQKTRLHGGVWTWIGLRLKECEGNNLQNRET